MPYCSPLPAAMASPFLPSPSKALSPGFTPPGSTPMTSPPTHRTKPISIPASRPMSRRRSSSVRLLSTVFTKLKHTDSIEILRHGKHAQQPQSQGTAQPQQQQQPQQQSSGHRSSKAAAQVPQQQAPVQQQAYYNNDMPTQGLSAGTAANGP